MYFLLQDGQCIAEYSSFLCIFFNKRTTVEARQGELVFSVAQASDFGKVKYFFSRDCFFSSRLTFAKDDVLLGILITEPFETLPKQVDIIFILPSS